MNVVGAQWLGGAQRVGVGVIGGRAWGAPVQNGHLHFYRGLKTRQTRVVPGVDTVTPKT